jgi:putative oxidoreductase
MLNISVWVLQFLLAAAFLAHGWMFLSPPASLVEQINAAINPSLRLFIGVAEVLGAIGLTLPGLTRIMPSLVPTAAAGLATVTLSATVFHATRGEIGSAVVTAILFLLASFVAYTRWKVLPIRPRTAL